MAAGDFQPFVVIAVNSRLLLLLLTTTPKRRLGQAGFSMLAGILVLLALVVGTVGLSSLVSGSLFGNREQGSSSEARSAAEAGIDEIIATWNQPQNRKLLVSGQSMSSWATSTTLQSPCVSTDGKATRPGGTGLPTADAKGFGDGEFRDLATGTKNTGDRQFALVSVTYSAGASGAANRRSISVSSTKTGGATTVGSFTGDFSNLINLDDPDGTGTSLPGANSGFITVTVQGKVVRGATDVATATVTREFEVLPKCCGASFGSNASTNLGSDNRACGVEFGLITGINGGTHFSYFANDRFTTVNKANQVVPVSSMIGLVNKGETTFNRANWRVSPNSKSVNSSANGTPSDATWWNALNTKSCGANCGTTNDYLGTSISGIPIVPGSVTLPNIGSETTAGNYYYTWSTGGWAASVIASNYNDVVGAVVANAFSPTPYMLLQSAGTTYRFQIRTNTPASPTAVDRARVEICNATASACTSTSWENVSDDRIADNFNSNTYSGSTGNANITPATVQWLNPSTGAALGPWIETDAVGAAQSTTAGKVRIIPSLTIFGSSNSALRLGNIDSTTTNANTASIRRGVNLTGFASSAPRLKYQVQGTLFDAGDTVLVQASSNDSTWVTIDTITGTAANTAETRVTSPIPSAQVGANTRIRFINSTALANGEFVTIDNIQLAPRGGVNSFCEYTSSSPQTNTPGFHCVGPRILLNSGGTVVMDTTGGPLSIYYSQTGDIRGASYAAPLMATGNSASIQHVKCATLTNTCTTQIPDTDPYADVGVPDRLNFFGRDNGSLASSPGQQYINIGATGVSSATTGKISRAWLYFPWGNVQLISDGCSDGSTPAGFNNDNSWSINGRVWVSSFRPCGAFHFRIPPSSSVGLSASFSTGSNPDYVSWTGVDWVARAVTSSRNY
jgi:hypothetical protein